MKTTLDRSFRYVDPRDASAPFSTLSEPSTNSKRWHSDAGAKSLEDRFILIINQAHLIRDDEDGRDLIELIQQRAEQWAASNLATIIINSDKYWVFERLKHHATQDGSSRKSSDLCRKTAPCKHCENYRMKYFCEKTKPAESILEEVYDKIGGRLTFLNRVAKSRRHGCHEMRPHLPDLEKIWFLNNCAILGDGNGR